MKRLSLFLPIVLLGALVFVFYACEEEPEECAEPEVLNESCEGEFSFCASDGENYFQYGEQKFYCTEPYVSAGESCSDALDNLMVAMNCNVEKSAQTKATLIYKSQRMMNQILGSVTF